MGFTATCNFRHNGDRYSKGDKYPGPDFDQLLKTGLIEGQPDALSSKATEAAGPSKKKKRKKKKASE